MKKRRFLRRHTRDACLRVPTKVGTVEISQSLVSARGCRIGKNEVRAERGGQSSFLKWTGMKSRFVILCQGNLNFEQLSLSLAM